MGRCNLAILLVVVLLTANVLIGCAGASKESAEFHYNKGKDLVEQRNCNEAVQEFDEAIRLNPNYDAAYLNRGFAYKLPGKKAEAVFCIKLHAVSTLSLPLSSATPKPSRRTFGQAGLY